jgi:hypothetical protein
VPSLACATLAFHDFSWSWLKIHREFLSRIDAGFHLVCRRASAGPKYPSVLEQLLTGQLLTGLYDLCDAAILHAQRLLAALADEVEAPHFRCRRVTWYAAKSEGAYALRGSAKRCLRLSCIFWRRR